MRPLLLRCTTVASIVLYAVAAGAQPPDPEAAREIRSERRLLRQQAQRAMLEQIAAEGDQRQPAAIHERIAASRGILRNSTVGIGGSITPAAAPGAVDPSITVDKDFALGSASNVFKNGTVFLWDDGGQGNLGLGRDALSNTTGSYNTAIGYNAGYNTTTGSWNTAAGNGALYSNYTGIDNSAFGWHALYGSTSSFNTAVGTAALGGVTGSDNTALGWYAGFLVGGGSYNIHIGSGIFGAGDSYTTRIGSSQSQAYVAGIYGSPVGVYFQPVYVDASGKLGTAISSQRFKTDIEDLGAGSEAVLELRPVSFRFKAQEADRETAQRWGLIAEEVAEILPELVIYDDGGRPQSVRYNLLSTLLLNELQKQHELVGEQARQLQDLRRRLARLEAEPPRGGLPEARSSS